MLSAFAYELGMPMPHAFLAELRLAMPILRRAAPTAQLWSVLEADAWRRLLRCVRGARAPSPR